MVSKDSVFTEKSTFFFFIKVTNKRSIAVFLLFEFWQDHTKKVWFSEYEKCLFFDYGWTYTSVL